MGARAVRRGGGFFSFSRDETRWQSIGVGGCRFGRSKHGPTFIVAVLGAWSNVWLARTPFLPGDASTQTPPGPRPEDQGTASVTWRQLSPTYGGLT